jgi:hypothetical protein
MHLRRVLLLFAIVLGLAALAATLSRPHGRAQPAPTEPPSGRAPSTATPGEGEVTFTIGRRLETRRIPAQRAAQVTVAVEQAGQVDLPGLGLTSPAEHSTPARFEVFAPRAGRYEVRFTPADAVRAQPIGTLVVESPGARTARAGPT